MGHSGQDGINGGAVMVGIVYGSWIYNYIFVPMQSAPITTYVVSSNPTQARSTRYNIM